MQANNKTIGGLIAIGFAIVAIVVLTPWLAVRVVQAASSAAPTSVCQDVKAAPRYMAYDRDTKTDNFGPAVTASKVSDVTSEFHARVCTDAALIAAEAAYFRLDGFTFQNYTDKAHELNANHDAWRATVKQLDNVVKDAQSVTVERSTAAYQSLWFTHGTNSNRVPALKQGPIGARDSVVLKVVDKNDKVYMLRLECGFQPFAPNFPNNVPPVHHKPPTGHTPPGHHGPCVKPPKPAGGGAYVYNPKTCTWHKPGQSFDQMQNQSAAHQDVQDNSTSGVNTGHTSGASTPPKPQPTQPVNTSSPPPPTSGGYNGGSTTQPGQTASPTPVVPSSDPTNGGDPGGF